MELWKKESPDTYSQDYTAAPAYMPSEHQIRWMRLRSLRLLFAGRHRQFFLDEGRTQFDYPPMEVQGRVIQPYHTVNLLKLMSVKTADLLFSSKAKLTAPTTAQQDQIDLLARNSMLHPRFHATVVAASWAGYSFLNSVIYRGEPYIERIEPDDLFPIGQMLPNGQYNSYVRYATANVGTEEHPKKLLLKTYYEIGQIRYELRGLNDNGIPESGTIDLKEWPGFGIDPPVLVQKTGINENTITFVPNELDGMVECSDYDGLIGLQDTVNAKFAQVARVIAMHTDPNLAMPAQNARKDGNYSSRYKVFYYQTKDQIPQYIVWSAQLEAAMADRLAAINAFCITGEVSQVLLGLKEGAAPDAARKLRLEATNFLAKVSRKALLIAPAIARSIRIAQLLDQSTAYQRSYAVDEIGVQMRDGLPEDELDKASTIATLRGAGAMSQEAAVDYWIEDPDEASIEKSRLIKEQNAATPSVLLNEPGTEAV